MRLDKPSAGEVRCQVSCCGMEQTEEIGAHSRRNAMRSREMAHILVAQQDPSPILDT
jgi:hypothetical protein